MALTTTLVMPIAKTVVSARAGLEDQREHGEQHGGAEPEAGLDQGEVPRHLERGQPLRARRCLLLGRPAQGAQRDGGAHAGADRRRRRRRRPAPRSPARASWRGWAVGPGSTNVERTKTISAPTRFVLTSRMVSSDCTRVRRPPGLLLHRAEQDRAEPRLARSHAHIVGSVGQPPREIEHESSGGGRPAWRLDPLVEDGRCAGREGRRAPAARRRRRPRPPPCWPRPRAGVWSRR